jgi:septum formation topological specificity factor MinE
LLLREDGSSVAFPEAVEQMRDDMQQVVERLTAVKVDAITQGLEQDIIAALEETIAALEKAIKDLEKNRTPPGQLPMAGQPTEPQLVDKLAELKMIRSLQMRIYQRTQRYGQMFEGEQAETAELIEALKDLAERQQRVHQATADLQQGRND